MLNERSYSQCVLEYVCTLHAMLAFIYFITSFICTANGKMRYVFCNLCIFPASLIQ